MITARPDGDERSGTQLLLDAINDGELFIEGADSVLRVHALLKGAKAIARNKTALADDLLWFIWDNAVTSDGQKLSVAWRNQALRPGVRGAAADRDGMIDELPGVPLHGPHRKFIEPEPDARPSLHRTADHTCRHRHTRRHGGGQKRTSLGGRWNVFHRALADHNTVVILFVDEWSIQKKTGSSAESVGKNGPGMSLSPGYAIAARAVRSGWARHGAGCGMARIL